MHASIDAQPFPRGPLYGAGALVLFAIGLALFTRVAGTPSQIPVSTPIEIRELRFADRADGGVDVTSDLPGNPVQTVAPGSNGFLRATVRGLVSQRKREGKGDALPFRLTAWADGRLSLDDPATGRHVELEAFGPTNATAFVRFLGPGEAEPAEGAAP